MKIVIFGATGRTGQYLLTQALDREHTVTAVARHPEAITLRHEHLRVVSGLFDQPETIDAAISGQTAVLSAVGAPMSRAATCVHADSARSIVAAMGRAGVRRLICVTSGGTNPQHDPNLPFIFEQVFKRMFANIYQDQIAMEQIVMASDTDWTIVRPAALTDGPAIGYCRVAEAYAIRGGNQTPRADLADFMLKQLDDPTYIRKAVALAI
jgi:putative NADH-flavin reductase